ncbi:MAG: HAMP domain-containing histidine kinase, partial [Spirochaetaceae bacterium]|nr:HAMP domain-containing histidine kinase [Spirochaetaceae bacterium]
MKIKSYFYLLILGIIVVPVLAVLGQWVMFRIRLANNAANAAQMMTPVYEEITPFLNERLSQKDLESIASFIARMRPNTNVAVFREDMMVIYSTIQGIRPGSRETGERIMSLIGSVNSGYGYSFETPPWIRGSRVYILLQSVPWGGDRNSRPRPPFPMYNLLLVAIALVVLFAMLMSFLIARSITRSVTVLEGATRRIASGDLDLEIDLKGINEITSLTESFNRMRLELKEEEQRRSRFIMGITHDLKTPLALIKGYAEAIEDGVTPAPEANIDPVKIIVAKADQLEGMIDDLLEFVRTDSDRWRRGLKPVDLGAFLGDFAKRARADGEILGRRIETRIDLPQGLSVPMDERMVTRALENLVNNAIRYTRKGGRILIGAHLDGQRALITVQDDGAGIDEKDLPHIFEIFYRGTSSRREQGMGLGLAITKQLLELMGGFITVKSVYGKGSTFTAF